jgi:hypothetical protein
VTGPVEEGSVVANVKADISNLEENVAKAQAKLEELTGKKTDVNVGAKTETAQAQLKALQDAVDKVSTAETRLAAAERASQNAASQSYVANLRLEQELTKRGRTELSVAAASEASARADRNAEAAELRHAAATDILTAAQARLKTVSDAALANDSQPASDVSKPAAVSNDGGGGSASYMQTILLIVAALVPLMAALAGYAVGVAGALAGMGAAGVLAVVGIKNAMDAGTSAGNTFSGGLHILKGDLDKLGATAANAMLKDFQAVVSMIGGSLPALSGEVKIFSGLLGTTGNVLVSGVISAFKVLNPLFIQAGVYVEELAVGFQKWTTGGGLASFAAMAVAELPRVAQALGSLLSGVVSVIGALQPLGNVMLGVISVVGQLLAVISTGLGPAFAPIVAGALAAVGAFRLFTTVTPVVKVLTLAVTALGIEVDAALGPIGWIAAAIAAVAAIAMTAAQATNNAAEASRNYTAAVQQDSGVIGEHTKAQAADTLQSAGALAAAKQLGISSQTVTKATLGNSRAQAELSATLHEIKLANNQAAVAQDGSSAAYKKGLDQAEKNAQAITTLTAVVQQNRAAVKDAIKAYNDIASAQGLTSIKTKEQLAAQTALASSYGESLPVYLAAQGSQKQTADQAIAATAALVQQNDAVSLLNNAFTILNGGSLNVAQAQTGAAAAYNTLTDSIKTNGTVIDGNSKAAVANQQAIQQKVLADQQAAAAVQKTTGSVQAGVAAYAASKQSLEDQLKAVGDLTPAMQAYIDQLYDVADFKPTPTKLDVDTATATKKLDDLKAYIESFNATTQINISTGTGGTLQVLRRASGGTIDGFAAGGSPGLSGTVNGPGTSTSDSILARLSRGEEVVRAAAASFPGVRPLLKSINSNPAAVMASGAGKGTTVHHWNITGYTDPAPAVKDGIRQLNLLVA